eukprot:m.250140 g.250140  ORF g.250140 m.250140 type:complete len:675 (-) comp17172_c6_seq2:44-2068(-)
MYTRGRGLDIEERMLRTTYQPLTDSVRHGRETGIVAQHKAEIQSLMSELQARDSELNEMSASHSKQLEAWLADKQHIKHLEELNAQLRAQVSTLERDNSSLLQRAQALASQLEDGASKEESLRQQLLTAGDKLHAMTARWENTNRELEAVTERSNTSSALITELQDAMRAMREADSATREELDRLQAKVELLQAEKEALERRLENSESSKQALESRYHDLSRSIETVKAKYTQAEVEISRREQQIQQLEASLEAQRKDVDKTMTQLNKAQADISNFQRDIALMDKEIKLSQEREKRKDKLLELAKSKEDRLEKELRAMRLASDQADATFGSLTQEVANLRRRLHDRETELEMFRQARLNQKEDAVHIRAALNDMTRRLRHHVSDLKAHADSDAPAYEGSKGVMATKAVEQEPEATQFNKLSKKDLTSSSSQSPMLLEDHDRQPVLARLLRLHKGKEDEYDAGSEESHEPSRRTAVVQEKPQYQAGTQKRELQSHHQRLDLSDSDLNLSTLSTDTQDVEAVLAATADLLARTRKKLREDDSLHESDLEKPAHRAASQGRNPQDMFGGGREDEGDRYGKANRSNSSVSTDAHEKSTTRFGNGTQRSVDEPQTPVSHQPVRRSAEYHHHYHHHRQQQEHEESERSSHYQSLTSSTADDLIRKLRMRLQTLPSDDLSS